MLSVSANPIIPTQFRSKIAHTHSYPLGAQEISRALAKLPNFNRIELTFTNAYKQQPHAGSYEVLWLYCRRLYDSVDAERLLLEIGEPNGLLDLTVRPVPRASRHEIRTKLLDEALPAIQLWIVNNRT